MYTLHSLGRKNNPVVQLIFSGTKAQCGRELQSRRQTDRENEFAIYDVNGRLISSTFSGGANPHAWDTRASGKSRKLSGLSAARRS